MKKITLVITCFFTLSLSSAQVTTFQKVYGYVFNVCGCEGSIAQQTSDGGYVITGTAKDTAGAHIYVIKTDFIGHVQWSKIFGQGLINVQGFFIKQTFDQGYIISGRAGGPPN